MSIFLPIVWSICLFVLQLVLNYFVRNRRSFYKFVANYQPKLEASWRPCHSHLPRDKGKVRLRNGGANETKRLHENCHSLMIVKMTHLNPSPVRAFLITRTVRGIGTTPPPPWRSAPDGRRASCKKKKTVDVSRRYLAITHTVFSPRSTFDLVRSGQKSNFREK